MIKDLKLNVFPERGFKYLAMDAGQLVVRDG